MPRLVCRNQCISRHTGCSLGSLCNDLWPVWCTQDVPMAGDQGGKVGGLQRAETSGPQLGSMILDPRPSAAERPR